MNIHICKECMRIYIWLLYASSGHTKHWDGGMEDIDMNIYNILIYYICIIYHIWLLNASLGHTKHWDGGMEEALRAQLSFTGSISLAA